MVPAGGPASFSVPFRHRPDLDLGLVEQLVSTPLICARYQLGTLEVVIFQ
jgi:hypothetical protein